MSTQTAKGFPYPQDVDLDKPRLDIEALAEFLDDIPGVRILTTSQRDALATRWPGMVIFNTTTGRLEQTASGSGTDWLHVAAWSAITGKPATFAPSPHTHDAGDIATGTLTAARLPIVPISKGGTGASTAEAARLALGLGTLATKSSASLTADVAGVLPIANGGTGASTATAALQALGLTATATELNRLAGVTSSVQGQLNAKAAAAHAHSAADVTSGILPLVRGGTGGSTAAAARSGLGITAGTAAPVNGPPGNIYFRY